MQRSSGQSQLWRCLSSPVARKRENVKTLFSDAVFTPNNIAAVGDGSFLVTNNYDNKVSMVSAIQPFSLNQPLTTNLTQFRELAFPTGGGRVAYCCSNQCHFATSHKSWFANGIVKGHDGLYYVAQSASGKIYVYSMQEDHSLLKIDKSNVGRGSAVFQWMAMVASSLLASQKSWHL